MGTYKGRRRQSKYKQILKNELGIDCTEEPSMNVMIGNAGLVLGVQYEQLAQLFTKFGSVQKIIMIPKKSYSFVVFSSIEEAVTAYNAVNGEVKLDNMDGPMYLVYTSTVPPEYNPPASNSLPEGLTLLEDFVTPEEEDKLLNCIDWKNSWEDAGKTLKHRRVKHYGYEFRYDTNNVDKNTPLSEPVPEECSIVESRLRDLGQPLPWTPDQLTINQYQRGQGIPSHFDTHSAFESPLLSLSLGSDVVMEFRRGGQHISVLLPQRSLLIMDGESRYAWAHGITPRSMDVVTVKGGGLSVRERGVRTSFTLRKVRQGACQCQYQAQCDSQQPSYTQPILSDQQASLLEQLYVHDVYKNIAGHFSETRTKVWPNVEEFLRSFSQGSILVDAGCGNGKYFGVNPHVFQVGFDRSAGLAEITKCRGGEVFVSDCLQLPLRDRSADGLISIAVLHHLSTKERRLLALQEMSRVLRPGGRALVTVWAKDQSKQDMTAYLKQDRKNRRGRRTKTEEKTEVETTNTIIESVHERLSEGDNPPVESLEEQTEIGSKAECDLRRHQNNFKFPVHTNRTEFQHQDVFVPWKTKSKYSNDEMKEVFLRYYHVFEENELLNLCGTLQDINVLQTYYTEGNWCIIFEKVEKL